MPKEKDVTRHTSFLGTNTPTLTGGNSLAGITDHVKMTLVRLGGLHDPSLVFVPE
jgi:hypothetical protein